MGNYVGKAMEENLAKQQQFMVEMGRITMERQIQMQDQMRERMMATQIARARDLFVWLGSFYGVAGGAMLAGFARTKNPRILAPLLPLTFVVGYQADMAYGTKMNRIKAEAENIVMYEKDLIEIPGGLPTLSTIDAGRMKAQQEKKYHAFASSQT